MDSRLRRRRQTTDGLFDRLRRILPNGTVSRIRTNIQKDPGQNQTIENGHRIPAGPRLGIPHLRGSTGARVQLRRVHRRRGHAAAKRPVPVRPGGQLRQGLVGGREADDLVPVHALVGQHGRRHVPEAQEDAQAGEQGHQDQEESAVVEGDDHQTGPRRVRELLPRAAGPRRQGSEEETVRRVRGVPESRLRRVQLLQGHAEVRRFGTFEAGVQAATVSEHGYYGCGAVRKRGGGRCEAGKSG